jgi:hypothetical protein
MSQDPSYTSHLASRISRFHEIITLYTLTQRCVTWCNNCNERQQALQRGLKRQAAMRIEVEILFNLLVYCSFHVFICLFTIKVQTLTHSPTTSPHSRTTSHTSLVVYCICGRSAAVRVKRARVCMLRLRMQACAC